MSAEKSLADKLGFAPGDTVFVEDTPDWYSEFAYKNGLELEAGLPAKHVHLFADSKSTLKDFLDENDLSEIEKSFWVSWPKKASGIKSDLNEQDLRDLILPLGWVDTKVASIDDTWSGLKFLRRKNT
ncbi:MAG: hypothetical protein ACXWLH_06425 [Candidatus Saccharimonadales bacterium]